MRKKKIALICGSDIVAHREMVHTVKYLIENDYEPVLFYPDHLPSKNKDAQQQIFRDYAYVERLILGDVIFPYLEANSHSIKSPFPTPRQLAARYGLAQPVKVADVNDPSFYKDLSLDPNLIGSISLRCTQKFGKDATAALKSQGRFLINAHSGLLPEFRGLYSTPRAIFEAIKNPEIRGEYGATIHHIEAYMPVKGDSSTKYSGIDTGNVIDVKAAPVDPTMSVYAHNIELSNMVGDAMRGVIDTIVRRQSLRGTPQVHAEGRYFSYGTPEEVKAWHEEKMVMFESEEVVRLLTETFISDSRFERGFENLTRDAIHRNVASLQGPSSPSSAPSGKNDRRSGDRRSSRGPFGNAVANDTTPTPPRGTRRAGPRNDGKATAYVIGNG